MGSLVAVALVPTCSHTGAVPPSPPTVPTKFRLTSTAQATLVRSLAIVVVGLGLTLLLLVKSHPSLALGVLVVLWVVFFWPTKLEVGPSDLRVSWLGMRKTIPYSEIVSTTVYYAGGIPFGIAVNVRNGKQVRLPVFRPAMHRQRQILRSVLATIAAAQTKAGFATTPSDVLSMPPVSSRPK